jgi:hypothetical protein
VREELNNLAEGWSEAEKMACMEETAATFSRGGGLMKLMMPQGHH